MFIGSFVSPRQMQGISLLEVMVSVLILGVGMLGIAAMQATALRNSQSALDRSQATIQAYSILDAMRANVAVAKVGGYNLAKTCDAPTGADRVSRDIATWFKGMQDVKALNTNACGKIECTSGAASCTVTVYFNDARGSGGVADTNFVITTRL